MTEPGQAPVRVRIWDWPTRIFHWLLVALIPVLWWTAEEGMMDRHRAAGYVMLGLILFRLLWGFIGSSTSRFSNFVKGPRSVMSYLNRNATHVLGHNPIGGWSVAAMLGLLSLHVGLGLFASDEDGLEEGPLAQYISFDTAHEMAELHELLFNLLLALIAIHVIAILFYLVFRRDNLVGPMLTGSRSAGAGTVPMQGAPAWRFILAAALAAAAAWGISSLG